MKVNKVYFSASGMTKKLVNRIGDRISKEANIYDLIRSPIEKDIHFQEDDILLVGMPVFAGRIPSLALPMLKKLKGNNTKAIILVTYGNRDYDDALLELKDLLVENGFNIISAGAFIAKHSIFQEVATDRPDDSDLKDIDNFTDNSLDLINNINFDGSQSIDVDGNFPYKEASNIPLKPKGDSKCTSCGICVHTCPSNAISIDSPRKTDKDLCISCMACQYVCPENARDLKGLMHWIGQRKFKKDNAERLDNKVFYIR